MTFTGISAILYNFSSFFTTKGSMLIAQLRTSLRCRETHNMKVSPGRKNQQGRNSDFFNYKLCELETGAKDPFWGATDEQNKTRHVSWRQAQGTNWNVNIEVKFTLQYWMLYWLGRIVPYCSRIYHLEWFGLTRSYSPFWYRYEGRPSKILVLRRWKIWRYWISTVLKHCSSM